MRDTITFFYHRLHVPTGTETIRQREFTSAHAFLNALYKWNHASPRLWQYRAAYGYWCPHA
jgi:hypothetical protein